MRCQDQRSGRKKPAIEDCRAPGRPRDPTVEQRILEVTLRLLREEGFTRMSVDAIALEAAVSKPTIYRRWRDKADLATSALMQLRISEPAVPQGNCRERLSAVLRNFRRSLLRPHGFSLIGTVLAEEEHTPGLLALFRERVVTPRREMILGVLVEARELGEIAASADLEAAVTMLVGSFYGRYLAGEPIPVEWIERVVGVAWRGLGGLE